MLLGGGLAVAARLDEAGAVAIAAILVRHGMHPAFAVIVMIIGTTLRRFSLQRWLAASAAALGAFWLSAAPRGPVIFDLFALRDPVSAQVSASPAGAASAAVLIAMVLTTLWREGARGWFAPLRHGRAA